MIHGPLFGAARVVCIDDPKEIANHGSPHGKSFLRVTFEDPVTGARVTVNLSTNLAEMIGGAGAGLRQRREAAQNHSLN